MIFLLVCAKKIKSQNIPSQRLTNWSEAGLDEAIQEPANLINFIDAGGKYNDAASNDSVLNQLLTQGPITIYFPNGQYNFSHAINLPSNTILRGESADSTIFNFHITTNSSLINITGTLTSDTFRLSSDANQGSSYFILYQSSGIQVGDLYKIVDNDSALVTSSWALYSTGQLVTIDSIIGNRIIITSELRRKFMLSKKSWIQKINPVKNVAVKNITLICGQATNNHTANIYMNYASNCQIKCIQSQKANFAHIDVRNSTHILIEGSYFKDAWSYGGGGKGYGVVLHHSTSDCRVSDNIFNHLRHSILLQAGANGNVISYNYSTNPFWTGVALPSNSAGDLVLHGNWPYRNLFEGNIVQNIVIDNSHGKNGPNNTFLRNRAELFGIFMNNSITTDSLIFVGNETTGSGLFYGNISLSGVGHFSYGNNQKGSIIPSGTGNPTIASLYLTTAPVFYQNWPLIGLPNSLNAHNNRAKTNYLQNHLTLCSVAFINGNYSKKKAFQKIRIYPNPVKNILFFDGYSGEKTKIKIFSICGKMEISAEIQTKLDVSRLPAGIYFVVINSGTEEETVLKMIKQ